MASRIQICKDVEEMLRMLDAGLLLANYGNAGADFRWRKPLTTSPAMWVSRYNCGRYNCGTTWSREDFGYLVEEDDNG